jgi:hypothetical protein
MMRAASPFAGTLQSSQLRKAVCRSMLRSSLRQQRTGLASGICKWRTTASVRFFYVRCLRASFNGRALAGVPSGTPVSTCTGTPTLSCARPPQLALGFGFSNLQVEAASCALYPRTPAPGKTPHSFNPSSATPCATLQPPTRINPLSMQPARLLSLLLRLCVRRCTVANRLNVSPIKNQAVFDRDTSEMIALIGDASRFFSHADEAFSELATLFRSIQSLSDDSAAVCGLAAVGLRITHDRSREFQSFATDYSTEVERHG